MMTTVKDTMYGIVDFNQSVEQAGFRRGFVTVIISTQLTKLSKKQKNLTLK